MRLDEPLLRLPLQFDAPALAAEVDALPQQAWRPHPNKLPGNEAALLVTTDGTMTDDIASPMAPTPILRALPCIMQAMAAIGAVWGRSRLMRLAPGAVVPQHVDTNFYWRTHVRIHVPIVTSPEVLFTCDDRTVHMAAGECWIFDTFAQHRVRNGGTRARTHLVLDTVGGEALTALIDAARAGEQPRTVGKHEGAAPLTFEQMPTSTVMTPYELAWHVAFIRERARPDAALDAVLRRLDRFAAAWTGVWAQYGSTRPGIPQYRALMSDLDAALPRMNGAHLKLRNDLPLYRQVAELLFTADATLAKAVPAATCAAPVRAAS